MIWLMHCLFILPNLQLCKNPAGGKTLTMTKFLSSETLTFWRQFHINWQRVSLNWSRWSLVSWVFFCTQTISCKSEWGEATQWKSDIIWFCEKWPVTAALRLRKQCFQSTFFGSGGTIRWLGEALFPILYCIWVSALFAVRFLLPNGNSIHHLNGTPMISSQMVWGQVKMLRKRIQLLRLEWHHLTTQVEITC